MLGVGACLGCVMAVGEYVGVSGDYVMWGSGEYVRAVAKYVMASRTFMTVVGEFVMQPRGYVMGVGEVYVWSGDVRERAQLQRPFGPDVWFDILGVNMPPTL